MPQNLDIFQSEDLSAGIFGSYVEGAKSERHAVAVDLLWGTFAAWDSSGLKAPSSGTTELMGVIAMSNSSSQAKTEAKTVEAGTIGAVIKGGKVVCKMDLSNVPTLNAAVSINLSGEVTSLTSGGVLNADKRAARVSYVGDTYCEVELAGDAVIDVTYVA